jgi:hypothetical protein
VFASSGCGNSTCVDCKSASRVIHRYGARIIYFQLLTITPAHVLGDQLSPIHLQIFDSIIWILNQVRLRLGHGSLHCSYARSYNWNEPFDNNICPEVNGVCQHFFTDRAESDFFIAIYLQPFTTHNQYYNYPAHPRAIIVHNSSAHRHPYERELQATNIKYSHNQYKCSLR